MVRSVVARLILSATSENGMTPAPSHCGE